MHRALPVFALCLAAIAVQGQTTSSAPPVSSQSIKETDKELAKKGKVLFERTTDENGQTTDTTPAKPAAPAKPQISLTAPAGSQAAEAARPAGEPQPAVPAGPAAKAPFRLNPRAKAFVPIEEEAPAVPGPEPSGSGS